MKRLENKSVIITAAGQGIGKETAIRFFKEGANVIATDINRTNKLEELSKEYPKIKTYTLDSTNAADIKKFAGTISKVDVLFNCVGFVHNGTILECEEKDWDFSFNVNVRSMYLMIKNIIPKMVDQKSGVIINMASVVSSVKGVKDRFVYGATKAAVIGLTGTVHTPSWEDRVNSFKDPEKARKDFIDRQPMGRLGKPEEVAALATYLATDESAFSTGVVYPLDGGMTI
jgi:NAD(P)-dependent dehydrogenase (short-subunit alcohol dehydrogenase family)